jgi:hypothetical protein
VGHLIFLDLNDDIFIYWIYVYIYWIWPCLKCPDFFTGAGPLDMHETSHRPGPLECVKSAGPVPADAGGTTRRHGPCQVVLRYPEIGRRLCYFVLFHAGFMLFHAISCYFMLFCAISSIIAFKLAAAHLGAPMGTHKKLSDSHYYLLNGPSHFS